jgi:Flp pilus assembly protein TadD
VKISRLLSALAVLLVASTSFAALPFPPEKEKWLKLTSGELRIFSSASERETRELATNLLRMREAVGKVTQLKVRSPLPMYVFLFKNERGFAPYRDAVFQRRNANVTGVFLSSRSANFVILQGDAGSGVERVVYHELTHYFVENTLSGLPLWFNEGIAEYYSTFAVSGDKVSIGKPVPEHVLWLREGHVMPLPQLFAIDSHSPDYGEGMRQGVFYAESWALFHYLALSEQRRSQLPVFLSLIRSGKSTDEAFRTAFNATYAELEKELRLYLSRPTMAYISYKLTDLPIPEVSEPLPAARDEVLFALGSLLAHSNAATVGDAMAFLEEAVRLNPKNAEANAALGFVNELRDDRAAATAAYERANAVGSSDPQVYIAYGATILERAERSGNGPGGISATDVAHARQLFERAVQLDPASSLGHAGLGATYVISDGDVAPGIAALEKSLALAASQEEVAFNLIQLYARARRRNDAQRIFDTVVARSEDPELVRQGREAVLQADVQAAEDLTRAGKTAEALVVMRSVLSATTNPRLKAHLEHAIAEEEKFARQKQQIAILDAAFKKAEAHKYAEALKMLDDLLPSVTDPEMRAEVMKVRGQLAAVAAAGKKK